MEPDLTVPNATQVGDYSFIQDNETYFAGPQRNAAKSSLNTVFEYALSLHFFVYITIATGTIQKGPFPAKLTGLKF